MMWGTDAPFAATNDSYENLTDYLQKGSAFTEEELEDVYYNNAKFVYFD
jgi:predicted TIM-barrel fold metal-dependent hydrolase